MTILNWKIWKENMKGEIWKRLNLEKDNSEQDKSEKGQI